MRPGKVDTPMQGIIRESDPTHFPMVDAFIALKEALPSEGLSIGHKPPNDMLDTPENVAKFIKFILLDTNDEEFINSEWDIRDDIHQNRWHV